MPKVFYDVGTGDDFSLEGSEGSSVMQVAVANGVPGIIGECGGGGMCATCHVYVASDFLPLLPPIGQNEDDMLSCAVGERRPESRLACQIRLTAQLEGLRVKIPAELL